MASCELANEHMDFCVYIFLCVCLYVRVHVRVCSCVHMCMYMYMLIYPEDIRPHFKLLNRIGR